MRPEEFRAFADHLCKCAAKETLPRFRERPEVTNKHSAGFDPVTEADRNAETAIRKAIMDTYPDHGILGEEHGIHNEKADYQWVIDPIDGTRAFISGVPVWGTLIGLYHKGQPLAGVMDQPFTRERFICDGIKSDYNRDGETYILSTSKTEQTQSATLMTTDPRLFAGAEAQAFAKLENEFQLSRYGTDCYAFAMLAGGHIELAIESGVQLYDIAALVPIIEKAGGIFTDWEGNANPQGGRVIAAANPAIHQAAMNTLSGVPQS